MMVSVEGCLDRIRRRAAGWRERPKRKGLARGAAYFGCGFLLSGARLWGQMQPLALAPVLAGGGWCSFIAGLGSALGYWVFWQEQGIQGMIWSLGALVISGAGLRHLWAACVVAATGLAFQTAGTGVLALRIFIAALCGLWDGGVTRTTRQLAWGCGVLSLAGISPQLGALAVGFSAAAATLPWAVMAGLGADVGGGADISLTAAVCVSFFLRRGIGQRGNLLSPGLACVLLMALQGRFAPETLFCVILGSGLGAAVAFKRLPVSHRGGAQVRLEQTARVLNRLQRQLLEFDPGEPDADALAEQVVAESCGICELKEQCRIRGRLDGAFLQREDPFLCRKPGLAVASLRQGRRELRRIKASRAAQQACREALAQQYGFLSDALHSLADRLGGNGRRVPRFRIQVSARSQGRGLGDGDRVAAFPGTECRFFVVLCDGMGTGKGASSESRWASAMIREMLTAGLPPETVLGSLNSQLALTQRAGAVTVDLMEVRLDSGRAWVYKWGAGQSLLLRRKRYQVVGASGPPPGLDVGKRGENVSHVALDRGEVLLLISDGVRTERAALWAAFSGTAGTGEIAEKVLHDGGSREDDATVVAVRLQKV